MIWAELEAQNVATRVKDVFSNKVLNGEVITGKTPLGYKIKNKHLVPDEQAPAAQAAFSHYLKYNSLRRTLRMLNDDFGIVTPPGNGEPEMSLRFSDFLLTCTPFRDMLNLKEANK